MGFSEVAINHVLQLEFRLKISEILDHHNQLWLRNLDFKLFLSIYLLKKLVMLRRFYKNITGCVGITVYCSETIFITFLKENTVLIKLFKTSFGSTILASFTEFECHSTDTFGLI